MVADAAAMLIHAVSCHGVSQANTQQLAASCAALKAQREARAANLNPTRPGSA
jgi:hypothetical protein